MSSSVLYRSDPRVECLVLLGLLVAAVEFGFFVERIWAKAYLDSTERSDIALILSGTLTLMTLLLGFTYSLSGNRFEMRRQLVIDEANAIGTSYLRAETLPEPESSKIRALLRKYTALRAENVGGEDLSPRRIRELDSRTKQLQSQIWSYIPGLARKHPNPITLASMQSLNEMIDLHTKRLAAYNNRVPVAIYVVLAVVSVVAMWLVGFHFGSSIRRVRLLALMLALIISLVMWLIMDLDQPARGAIRTSHDSLHDLNRDLNQTSQDTATKSH